MILAIPLLNNCWKAPSLFPFIHVTDIYLAPTIVLGVSDLVLNKMNSVPGCAEVKICFLSLLWVCATGNSVEQEQYFFPVAESSTVCREALDFPLLAQIMESGGFLSCKQAN